MNWRSTSMCSSNAITAHLPWCDWLWGSLDWKIVRFFEIRVTINTLWILQVYLEIAVSNPGPPVANWRRIAAGFKLAIYCSWLETYNWLQCNSNLQLAVLGGQMLKPSGHVKYCARVQHEHNDFALPCAASLLMSFCRQKLTVLTTHLPWCDWLYL